MNEQLIKDFQEGKSYDYLCKTYHHKFKTIKKILLENNIDISKRDRKNYKTDKKITEEEINLICKIYLQGKSLNYLSKMFDISVEKIRKIIKKNNIKIRQISNKKYYLNEDYFDNLTENGAYILGFLAADGWIKKEGNLVDLTLSSVDKEILEKIKEEIQLERPLRTFIDSQGREKTSLTFSSQKIREIFKNYNLIPRKTFLLKNLPNLSKKLLIHYIRGYFDGDGSIFYNSNKRALWTIYSVNRSFLEDIILFLKKNYNIDPVNIYEDKRKQNIIYFFNYAKKESLKKIYEAIYNDKNLLKLERKFIIFSNIYNDIIKQETPSP